MPNAPKQTRTRKTQAARKAAIQPCSAPEAIRLRGVRQNNLKNFDLDIPLGQLIVVTGLSGAGKSSLVFETLHAEGQRRYVETFSPYIRQFLEMLDRPEVDSIENIRPSIAIQQGNTVKTSRSTVGTMTELCDYFKVWFCHHSRLIDPATGKPLHAENPQSLWRQSHARHPGTQALVAFPVTRPHNHTWAEIIDSLSAQGYTRTLLQNQSARLSDLPAATLDREPTLHIITDRIPLTPTNRARFIEAATQAFHYGQGQLILAFEQQPGPPEQHFATLHSPASGLTYKPATPALFSFNSPIGACPTCRGFGRIIEIDYRLVIPDENLTLEEGAIKPFQGQVYSESLRDLAKAAKKHKIPFNTPWRKLTPKQRAFIIDGEPGYDNATPETAWPKAWYGVRRFFEWLETQTYKMHVRVFLSKFRSYTTCPACGGTRLQPDALNWKWRGHTLPDLYQMPVGDLHQLLTAHAATADSDPSGDRANLALKAILTRLNYLVQVGLDYLTLDRSSRSLSGGEVERVNLTACLGTSLTDTLFVLDEPSIGLHPRDIGQLTRILRQLTDQGNTVVVVEHDEAVMRSADHLIEIGPRPGSAGGHITYQGPVRDILTHPDSLTGAYLANRATIPPPSQRRPVNLAPSKISNLKSQISNPPPRTTPALTIAGATLHNITDLTLSIPHQRFVCLAGISGSGKSTLLENVIHQGILSQRGLAVESPAALRSLTGHEAFADIVVVDQGPVSRTPRSNPALYSEAWDDIRALFARTDAARDQGLTTSHFSFNGGDGRCDHCQGLGFERVEMQFLSDVYVPCPICEGKRFKPEILEITYQDKSVADILALDILQACTFFKDSARIRHKLDTLVQVGLGYLTLGQPLNTLSGGESQRLKLVKYLARLDKDSDRSLILLDEPTTGLHRDDVKRLIAVLQKLTDLGHTLIVIEHQTDVLQAADWIIEMGPGAGHHGGQIIFTGTPEALARANTPTSPYLSTLHPTAQLLAAEPPAPYKSTPSSPQTASPQISNLKSQISLPLPPATLRITEAREHNLRNLSLDIPHRQISVVTGVSGSGKSTLAFDIIFAEGQRRFMESMSAYARQFVEQLPRPDIGALHGIPPTVAIEQRITRGSRKSTVATVTEVAQYLRLLYARVGIPHSPASGRPLVSRSEAQIAKDIRALLKKHPNSPLHLHAPIIRSRKGHHQPLADRCRDLGYQTLRIDGRLVPLDRFTRLDRYREHDIELTIALLTPTHIDLHGPLLKSQPANSKSQAPKPPSPTLSRALSQALSLGKGTCLLTDHHGKVIAWFSTARADPDTGEAYPELDPKHFSWNSPKGWCPTCRGFGRLYSWMEDRDEFAHLDDIDDGQPCPTCQGTRLNPLSRAVLIPIKSRISNLKSQISNSFPTPTSLSLPALLALPPAQVLEALERLDLDPRGQLIAREIIPEVRERLRFLDQVGLGYLTLDRASSTLSGGEAQRIRLAAQLGSNLSGVLYVLDEPSIGLHARDNNALISSLQALRDKQNTLLIVEHDEDTMRAADRIIDLGPAAGIHGGQLLANAPFADILQHPDSPTGRALREQTPHPWRGHRRPLPPSKSQISNLKSARKKAPDADWITLQNPRLRNLKGDDLHLPIARLSVVCGISGAGKSTLIRDLLKPAVTQAIQKKKATLTLDPDLSGSPQPTILTNAHTFRQCIEVDQEPIGKTPRSTPATYNGAFDLIREIFATLPEAKIRGFGPGAFSFNTSGGRCETCKGAGRIKLEMNFMPDTWTPCEDCGGTRYGPELADIRWNGKNIADILAMSFEEAADFFRVHTRLVGILDLMVETGLGYLTLGQSSPTLSGGEAQRLKLVSELALGLPTYREKSLGLSKQNLYLLEEPTIGLHLNDCRRLVDLLHRLVDQGHTVVVIEHHPDVIAEADYLIEVGPEGGEAGGHILYQGTPKGLLKVKKSPTAPFLRSLLSK